MSTAAVSSLDSLMGALGYSFKNEAFLKQALTHRSFGQPHNERLEFLGDAILNYAVARALFDAFPDLSEGELSRLRANLVNQAALAQLAEHLQLNALLRLGEGEVRSGGRNRPSILADTLEALFAAVCLDAHFDQAAQVVQTLYAPLILTLDISRPSKDAKSLLQEWLQAQKRPLPQYKILSQVGMAHDQVFEVQCLIEKEPAIFKGQGSNRRFAERAAAEAACLYLKVEKQS